jgi:hypothetical protein
MGPDCCMSNAEAVHLQIFRKIIARRGQSQQFSIRFYADTGCCAGSSHRTGDSQLRDCFRHLGEAATIRTTFSTFQESPPKHPFRVRASLKNTLGKASASRDRPQLHLERLRHSACGHRPRAHAPHVASRLRHGTRDTSKAQWQRDRLWPWHNASSRSGNAPIYPIAPSCGHGFACHAH